MKVCATVVISVIVGVLLGFYAPHSTAPSRSQSHASRRLVESSADVAEALAEVDLLVATDTALTSAAVSALAAAPNYAEMNRPDWEKFMAYLDEIQNPPSCAGVHLVTYHRVCRQQNKTNVPWLHAAMRALWCHRRAGDWTPCSGRSRGCCARM